MYIKGIQPEDETISDSYKALCDEFGLPYEVSEENQEEVIPGTFKEKCLELEEKAEEPEEESSTTGIEIAEELDQMMYIQISANARSGDNTDYEVVTTYGVNTEVHVTGRTANDWYRVEHSDGDVYVSGKLLGMEKVVVKQQATNGNSSGQQSGGSTASGGGSSSSGGIIVDGAGEIVDDGAFSSNPFEGMDTSWGGFAD